MPYKIKQINSRDIYFSDNLLEIDNIDNIKDVKKFNTFDSFLKKNLKMEQYKQYGKKVEIVRKTKGLMTKWMWR